MTTGDGEPVAIAGDIGYRANWIDEMFLKMDVMPVIPSKENEDCNTRPIKFDKDRYRQRNIVECLSGWLKECRCVYARYEKTAIDFAGMIKMGFIQRYLKMITE